MEELEEYIEKSFLLEKELNNEKNIINRLNKENS